ncbi:MULTISPECIES: site-specific DNA-methyltransferase [Bacillus]|uniref:Methyltransferase n=1 Tax=Bacillus subtilis subsp. subtilis TaxID=135461 RepID=A0ABD3ZQM7_BACIU|nr:MULTISPECIES: site-specific DNA-methyltransferase [Bacillus]AOA54513.1 Site-specific DNA-methyltransferase (adenine-specific) [Bacillus subtilis]KIL30484.1 Adenine-specific methyltransferase [Bacillus subtilis subsp. subtilis]KIN36731.1 Adenine-specific methyltransferase [Bacillus subtilis]KIN54094.1 Adenine-specific methyltransferase [Bacillus subtilis]MDP8528755.1 site-specific DNA-methyltransferase [Bacillus subtilis]
MGKELLGSIQLNKAYQLDCLEGMKLIPDKSVDMILCDLPYGTTQNKWDSIIPLDKLWEQYERIIKDNGAIVLTAQTPFDKVLGGSNLKLLKYEWIWEKNRGTGHLNAKKMPMKNHENILVFYKKLPTYNPQMREGEPYQRLNCSKNALNKGNYGKTKDSHSTVSDGKRYPLSVLDFAVVERTIHPTQKPVELFEYLIKTYTNEGEIVLDNCLGSGTTAIACELNNRKWIGFETEQQYIELINKRLDSIQLNYNLENLNGLT